MEKPFLYRYRTMCTSAETESYSYDQDLDMLVSYVNDEKIPVILSRSLGTKKENLEKGEDEGPSLIFNSI